MLTFFAPVREFFTLARAEGVARAYSPAQAARVKTYFDAGELRLSAARGVGPVIAAGTLLRDAVMCYLVAFHASAHGPTSEPVAPAAAVAAMPALKPDATSPFASPTDDERVRAALSATDPLYFDQLSLEDAAQARGALERAAEMLRSLVETRSLANIRAAR